MYAVSDDFKKAVRQSHVMASKVDVWRGNSIIASDVDYLSGTVTVNAGTGVRRTLDLTLPDRSLWDELSVPGTEIRPHRGVRFPNGSEEMVPLGVFVVDTVSMGETDTGGIAIESAPDRWSYVQRARFETIAASIPTNTVKAEVARLILAAFSTGVTNTATSTAVTGVLTYDRDREETVNKLLASIGAEAYFDNAGQVVIRDAPKLSSSPVWTVDAGAAGILLAATRRRDRTRTYNVVVVNVAVQDGQAAPAPVIVADDDPTSPTYAGGPMGRVPYFLTVPVRLDSPGMTAAGRAVLNRVKGINAQLTVEAVVNPALDRGDVLTVITGDGTAERHLVVSLTVPLNPDGEQSIETQSTRPDGDVPPEE